MFGSEVNNLIEQLYMEYSNDVYRYAWYILRDECEARDIVQEVFVSACRALDIASTRNNPKGWLLHITRHLVYDTLRQRKHERTYKEHSMLSGFPQQIESTIELEEMLEQLPLPQRQVVILRCIQDQTTKHTAMILGWSSVKVRVTLHRALKRLESLLSQPEEETIVIKGADTDGLR